MKSSHRLWHGRLWITLTIIIVVVLTMSVIFRPKIISQNFDKQSNNQANNQAKNN